MCGSGVRAHQIFFAEESIMSRTAVVKVRGGTDGSESAVIKLVYNYTEDNQWNCNPGKLAADDGIWTMLNTWGVPITAVYLWDKNGKPESRKARPALELLGIDLDWLGYPFDKKLVGLTGDGIAVGGILDGYVQWEFLGV
jgi:hypothetical protein